MRHNTLEFAASSSAVGDALVQNQTGNISTISQQITAASPPSVEQSVPDTVSQQNPMEQHVVEPAGPERVFSYKGETCTEGELRGRCPFLANLGNTAFQAVISVYEVEQDIPKLDTAPQVTSTPTVEAEIAPMTLFKKSTVSPSPKSIVKDRTDQIAPTIPDELGTRKVTLPLSAAHDQQHPEALSLLQNEIAAELVEPTKKTKEDNEHLLPASPKIASAVAPARAPAASEQVKPLEIPVTIVGQPPEQESSMPSPQLVFAPSIVKVRSRDMNAPSVRIESAVVVVDATPSEEPSTEKRAPILAAPPDEHVTKPHSLYDYDLDKQIPPAIFDTTDEVDAASTVIVQTSFTSNHEPLVTPDTYIEEASILPVEGEQAWLPVEETDLSSEPDVRRIEVAEVETASAHDDSEIIELLTEAHQQIEILEQEESLPRVVALIEDIATILSGSKILAEPALLEGTEAVMIKHETPVEQLTEIFIELFDITGVQCSEEQIRRIVYLVLERKVAFEELLPAEATDMQDTGTREVLTYVGRWFLSIKKLLEPLHTMIGRIVLGAHATHPIGLPV